MRDDVTTFGAMTRKEFLRVGALGSLAFLAGAKAALAASGKPVRVGMILPSYDQIRWRSGDQPGFESEARKLGIRPFVVASQMSETVQSGQVENMLTEGVDVVILRPVNAAASGSLVRKCNQAGVPVIAYDSLPQKADVACFVGRDAIEMAKSIAQVAVGARPKGNYVLALGDEGTNVAQEERKGYYEVLKPHLDSGAIKIVSEQFNKDWSTVSGRAQVENALTKNNNDVVAVLCGNDGVAYGAVQALQAQGLTGKVWVNGVDAEPRAMELIRDGQMAISNFTDYWQGGVQSARIAVGLAKGERPDLGATVNNGLKEVPWFKVDFVNFSKANLSQMADRYPWWVDRAKLRI